MTQHTTGNRKEATEDIPTTVNEAGLTWNQRQLFHTLVNDGIHEWNAYTACLSVE